MVGRTPLVELPRLSPKPGVRIFAKLEGQNPSGSVKDRVAVALVDAAERRGELKPGGTLIEASTGNTAIALAMVAKQRGYGLRVVIPRGVVPSISDVLELLGVEIVWVEPRAGMRGPIDAVHELAAKHGWVAAGQFEERANVDAHYATTGAEIAAAVPDADVFVAGIGTGGTIMGVSRRLREINPAVRVIGVEPRMGECLQGLRSLDEGYRPPLLDLDALDGRFLVGSATALELSRKVAREEGLLAGVSAGACLHAALRVAERLDRGNVVVMFSDGGWKYLPARPWQAAQAHDPALDDTHWW
jgi:cysteine synthase